MKRHAGPISLLGGFLLLAGFLTLSLDFVLDRETSWMPLATLGGGVVLAAISGLLEPGLFRHYGRWINASLGGIMVFLIVAMVNFLSNRHHERIDLTEGQLHSLADLTVETLRGLDQEVQVLGFMEGGVHEELEVMLEGYASESGYFSFELVDPDKEPQRTSDYGIRSYNTVVVENESTGQRQNVTELTEKELTNALLKVIREGTQRIYLTVGHGESGVQPGGAKAYGRLKDRLDEISFAVEDSLFLARAGAVPGDCAVLIVAGPQFAFLETEIQAIERYLESGGAALFLLDPAYEVGLGNLLAKWGVVVGDDFVIDTSGVGSLFGLDFSTPVAVQYDAEHPIVSKHRGGLMSLFELARSVRFEADRAAGSDLEGIELVMTSEQSWAEADVSVLSTGQGKRAISLDEDVDRVGPVALAVAVKSRGEAGGRLVVFGDSDFAADSYFGVQGNGDLALNAISWLAADESLISIRPKEAGHNPIALTEGDSSTITWLLLLYPLAIFVAGMVIIGRARVISPGQVLQMVSRVLLHSVARTSVVVLIIVAAVGTWLLDRHGLRFDLTEDGLYTLSADTEQLLSRVDDENRFVTVKTFMSKEEGMRFQDTLEEYDYLSRNFDYEIVDPQKNRLEVEQFGIRHRGTSIVEVLADGKVTTERFEEQTEEALSNAIQRALKAEERRLSSTGGHGEGQLTLVDGRGYSILNGRIKELNFDIEEGVDLSRDELAQGGQVLLVLAPKEPFTSSEVDALRLHLKRGGDALLLLDPGPPTGLEALLEEYSVDLGQDFIVDLSPVGQLFGADVSMPVVLQYGAHPIAETLTRGTMSFYPFARSVSEGSYQPGVEVDELVLTDQSSWGESDLSPVLGEGGKVEFDEGTDRSGPLSLAVAVHADADTAMGGREDDRTRLVVFGDADFATNDYFGQHANGELIINSLNWLVEGEDKLEIPMKTPRSNPINLIGNEGDIILWLSVFVLPLAVALCGMVVVLRRGAAGYLEGFVTWQMFCFYAAGALYLGIHLVESDSTDPVSTIGFLVASIANFAVARSVRAAAGRHHFTWASALVVSIANVGLAFSVMPLLWQQVVYAVIFAANTAMLVWMHRDATAGEASDGLQAGSK